MGLLKRRSVSEVYESPELHFEEFPEDVDITSVSIPISKEYLALEGELYIGDEKIPEHYQNNSHSQGKIK